MEAGNLRMMKIQQTTEYKIIDGLRRVRFYTHHQEFSHVYI